MIKSEESMNKEYRVSEKYLEEVIEKSSRALVGMVMKRFEIFKDKEDIKSSIKELIYENYRNLKGLIKSFSNGVKFITPKEQK